MSEMSFRLPEEWAREVAARVARTIRNACGQEADKNADMADQIDDACDAAVTATMQVLAEEFNGRDRLHDATAVAEAEARGRRQGLEEAAKVAEGMHITWDDGWGECLDAVEGRIRSLATAPAETQKPETGDPS